jgi:site-specific recombinase XerC
MTSIAPTLQGFFTERLISQRRVSPATIATYRDSLKLLLAFAQQRTGKPPNALDWADLDTKLITAFLDHLETERHNHTRTRNLRLTAIRSLFSTPRSSSRSWPSPPSGTASSSSRSSPRPRPTPCSPPAT